MNSSPGSSKLRGRLALVTGATSGLGRAIAVRLAESGVNLVIVSRSRTDLDACGAELTLRHNVDVRPEAVDLSEAGAAADLVQRLDRAGLSPDILVNNAGIGRVGPFVQQSARDLRSLLALNVTTLTELTHLYGQRMRAADAGHILLVASVAAYGASPYAAAYAASKAYVLSLGEALNIELGPNVQLTVLVPGMMETSMIEKAGMIIPPAGRIALLDPDAVAAIGVDAMVAGRPVVVAGRLNKFGLFIGALMPRRTRARIMGDARHVARAPQQ